MKIWLQYGSEHSSNLVMIGQFKSPGDALEAKEMIDLITEQARADEQSGDIGLGGETAEFSDKMRQVLKKVEIWNIGPIELEQFIYEFDVTVTYDKLKITTDEIDVSAFLKLLISKGARVEVYSAHHYPSSDK